MLTTMKSVVGCCEFISVLPYIAKISSKRLIFSDSAHNKHVNEKNTVTEKEAMFNLPNRSYHCWPLSLLR